MIMFEWYNDPRTQQHLLNEWQLKGYLAHYASVDKEYLVIIIRCLRNATARKEELVGWISLENFRAESRIFLREKKHPHILDFRIWSGVTKQPIQHDSNDYILTLINYAGLMVIWLELQVICLNIMPRYTN